MSGSSKYFSDDDDGDGQKVEKEMKEVENPLDILTATEFKCPNTQIISESNFSDDSDTGDFTGISSSSSFYFQLKTSLLN